MITTYIESTAPKPQFGTIALPASKEDIRQSLEELGVNDEIGYQICALESEHKMIDAYAFHLNKTGMGIEEVNFLAQRLENMSSADLLVYEDLLELHGPESLKDMINLTVLDGDIHLVPEIQTTKELGSFLVENGFVEIPQEYWKYLDYAGIGEEHLTTHTAAITKHGYIEDGRTPEEMPVIYDGVNLPEMEQPEQDMGQEMGF